MNPEDYVKELEKLDYNYFLEKALGNVPDGIDKRQGSIIYDAIAPVAYDYHFLAMQLRDLLINTFAQTASGKFLDYRAAEKWLRREHATYTLAKGHFKNRDGEGINVEIGDRFASLGASPFYYAVSKILESGYAELTCEQLGSGSNHYIGQILPITPNDELAFAEIIEVSVPAKDEESDEHLRERILQSHQINSFSGNVEDYIEFTSDLEEVGAVQVYPVWQGGGTVKIVILDNNYNIPTTTLVEKVQEKIDPLPHQKGYGIAPIGHQVTVAGPTGKKINVSFHVDTEVGNELASLKRDIQEALEQYFSSIHKTWSNHTELYQYDQTVYRSQMIAKVLQVAGVANVSNIKLNGNEQDVRLTFSNELQEVAVLGEVVYT